MNRDHWAYVVDVPQCIDPCTESGMIVRCLSTDPKFCDPDPICAPGGDVWCFRDFIFKDVIFAIHFGTYQARIMTHRLVLLKGNATGWIVGF